MSRSVLGWLFERVREIVGDLREYVSDPRVRRALYAEHGLDPDAGPPPEATWDSLNELDRYRGEQDPDLARAREAADAVIALFSGLRDHVDAIRAEAGAGAAAHVLLRNLAANLSQPHVLRAHPRLYYTMRAIGVIEESLHVHLSDVVRYDRLEALAVDLAGYLRMLLTSHPADSLPEVRDDLNQVWDELTQVYALETEADALRVSDLSLLPLAGVVLGVPGAEKLVRDEPELLERPWRLRVRYGWEALPQSETPDADRLARRFLSLSWTFLLDGGAAEAPITLTVAWIPRAHGGPALFLSVDAADFSGTLDAGDSGTFEISLDMGGTDRLSLLIPMGDEVDPALQGAVEAAARFTLSATGEPAAGRWVVPGPRGTRMELGSFAAAAGYRVTRTAGAASARLHTRLVARKTRLVLTTEEADPVVAEAIEQTSQAGLQIEFDLGLVLEFGSGGLDVRLDGGTGLNLVIPVGRRYGPVRVQHVAVSLAGAEPDGSPRLALAATVSLALETDWLTLTFDGVGLAWDLRSLRGFGFRPPDGVGVRLSLGPVSGGGFLLSDPDRQRYAAVLALDVEPFWFISAPFEVTAVVMVGDMAGARDFFVFLGAEWQPWHIGAGFTLNGVGGVATDNRTVAVDVLQAGLRNQILDHVLFPERPVERAPALIAALDAVFPRAPGQRVLGLMVKFGWGGEQLLVGTIAVLYESPEPRRVLLLGQLELELRFGDRIVAELRLQVVGYWHLDRRDAGLDGTLQGSRVAGFAVTGDGAWRSRGGDDPVFLLSVGGYHPDFEAPAGFPSLRRLSLALTTRDNPRVRFEAYFAITSNTIQVGGLVDFFFAKGGFSIEGRLALDFLLERDTCAFKLDIGFVVAVKRGRTVIASVQFTGTLSGTTPWRLVGEAKLELLFFSVPFPVDVSWGDEAEPAALAPVRAQQRLVAALRDPRSWRADPPEQHRSLVSLRPGAAPDTVSAHPLAPLTVSQNVLPLEVTIDHLGPAPLATPRRFALTDVTVGDVPVRPDPVTDHFAPAEFFALSDTERLSRPSFERLRSGVRFTLGGMTHGSEVRAPMEPETIVVDSAGQRRRAGRRTVTPAVLAGAVRAAESSQPLPEAERFLAPGDPITVEDPRFAVVSAADLRPSDEPQLPVATGGSYTEAREALAGYLRERAGGRGALRIIGVHEGALP